MACGGGREGDACPRVTTFSRPSPPLAPSSAPASGIRIWRRHARDDAHPATSTAWRAPTPSRSQGLPARRSSLRGTDTRAARWKGRRRRSPTEQQEAAAAGTCFLPAPGEAPRGEGGGDRSSRSLSRSPCPTWVAPHLSTKVAATREAGSCGDSGSGRGSGSSTGGGRQWRSEGRTH